MSSTKIVKRDEKEVDYTCFSVEERIWEHLGREMYSIDVEGNNGLSFTVEASRGLDISNLSFLGFNIPYIAENGIKAPEEFKYNNDFDKNMFFGMLTTCGLENTGPQSADEEESIVSQHGSQNNERAYNVSYRCIDSKIQITGQIASRRFAKHSFVTQRTITFDNSDNTIEICDQIVNNGEKDQLCLMYHINFGRPFLNENCIILIPFTKATPKNRDAETRMDEMLYIGKANADNPPLVYYLVLDASDDSMSLIYNPDLDIEVALEIDKKTLPKIDLWKNLRPERYVISFEPCNAFPYGRKNQILRHEAQFLEKGETKSFKLKLHFRRTNNEKT